MASDKIFSNDYLEELNPQSQIEQEPVTVFGLTFKNDEERRQYFREELRRRLPELRAIEGFPIGEDDDIINLSDPPYYTACPNPWLNDFIKQWEDEKKQLQLEGKRKVNFEVKEPYASDVSEGKNNPIYMAHAYHTKCPHPAIMRYIMHYTQPGDIVFDGFAGTGMTGVACGKCSDAKEVSEYHIEGIIGRRNCILGDLSPIASFITYNFNNPVDRKIFVNKANKIINEVKEEVSDLYKTKHFNNDFGVISYVIWSDYLVCPNCSGELSYWKESLDENMKIKPHILCPHCGSVVTKSKETIAKETIITIDGKQASIPLKKPALIRYSYKGKKFTKEADVEDFKLIERLNEVYPKEYYPSSEIIDGVKTKELIRAGYTNVSLLYTRRNLIVFAKLWEKARTLPLLRFALTSILVKTGSLLHNVGIKNGKINLAGALPNALFVPSALAERNVFELLEGKLRDILNMDPEELHHVCNQVQSATDLSNIESESIDYIFTDPPFGHNLMYSELNFIHEDWLKIYTQNKDEAIENSSQGKTVSDYTDLMTLSFREYYRILKPGKWMTVEFSNTSAAIWNSIQRALTKAGFIISVVRGLDKQQGSFNAQTTSTAVKQDLVISCYKNTSSLYYTNDSNTETNEWGFIEEHLEHLPVISISGKATTSIIERSAKILYDRLVSSFIERNLPVPIDASVFQNGLRERFIERDGMFFTAHQAAEYDELKMHTSEFVPMGLIVSDEANGIEWLKNQLREKPQTYQDIYPSFIKALNGIRKGDQVPGLNVLLEENFIQNDDETWRLPNINDDVDLEKLRNKALLKEFKRYLELCRKPRGKLKDVRVEAVRAGFKQCYSDKNFADIILVGDRIPQNLLTEDEILLQYYDIASSKV